MCNANSGQLNARCKFPFKFLNRTYNACTRTLTEERNGKPWCSTKLDKDGNHIEGERDEKGFEIEANWGICDDMENCQIELNGKVYIIDKSEVKELFFLKYVIES